LEAGVELAMVVVLGGDLNGAHNGFLGAGQGGEPAGVLCDALGVLG
jgi:hypothetical protein